MNEPRDVSIVTLREILKRPGQAPVSRRVPQMGHELLNALAEVFDLPLDCYGLDISVRVDGPVKIAIHRCPTIKGD